MAGYPGWMLSVSYCPQRCVDKLGKELEGFKNDVAFHKVAI